MSNLNNHFSINQDGSILEAWKKIEANNNGIVFVVDNKHRLVGSLSDGDIRRLILKTGSLNLNCSDAMNHNCYFITSGGLDNFDSSIKVLPIVDKSMHLIDLSILDHNSISIGNKTISKDSKPIYIAEIGNNHQGDIEHAFKLIQSAAESGADIVKFQMRDMNSLYRSDIGAEDLGVEYTKNLLSKYNLETDDLFRCFDKCIDHNVVPLCTPFDLESLKNLIDYGIPGLKVASADFVNTELLDEIIKSRLPFIISTGMASSDEISMITSYLRKYRANYIPLHCNSTYPTPYNDVNLNFMNNLKEISPHKLVGYSGHERGYEVCLGAIAMGAKIIEKHFTFDKNLEGADHKVSLLPSEFREMVDRGNNLYKSIGANSSSRKISQGEMINRENLGKSIVYKNNLKAGSKISRSDVSIQSPGRGLAPYLLPKILNQTLIKDVKANDFSYWSDFKEEKKVNLANFNRPFGIPVRFHDCVKMLEDKPYSLIEYHLTYDDLDKDIVTYTDNIQKVVVHSPELFSDDHILDLASDNKNYRNVSYQNLTKTITKAREIAKSFSMNEPIQLVTNVGGWTRNEFINDKQQVKEKYDLIKDSLNKFRNEDVEILIQTMPPYPWHFGGQSYHNLFVCPDEIIEFCLNNNYFLCLDLSHTYMACEFLNINFEKELIKLLPYSKHLHISDSIGLDGEGLQIGDGNMNFKKICEILNDYGDGISFIPEIWQGHKENGMQFKQAIEYLGNFGLR